MKLIGSFFCVLLAQTAFSQQVQKTIKRLPDTGQTQSFTTTFGEDNDYSIHVPAFVDHGNGAVTDTVTGLMWQKSDGGERSIEAAKTYVDSLNLGGHNDWRLPLPLELLSIFNHQKNNPAMDVSYFPSTGAEYWWTSIRQTGDSTKIWCGNAGGGIGNHPKTETISSGGTKKFHVKAVRDVQFPELIIQRFTDNLDGTISDNLTGLVWQKNPPNTSLTWEQALSGAESLQLAGFDDWRLPNIKELFTLQDASRINPAANPIFGLQAIAKYWSSTSIPGQQGVKAWYFDSRFGITTYDLKTVSYPTIAVRGLVENTTALNSLEKLEKLQFVPNPSSGNFRIKGLKAGDEIWLRDARGILIFQGDPQNHDFSDLPTGLYNLRDGRGRTTFLCKN